ncbi:MAG: DUF4159 domain-containing protein [Bacteroidetes bacterium]|nr:DUF4159 domain-containing protein [bacterium]NBP64807.1 DUF4159 domain-containing protein [Bacteroidota bacterium]
MKYLAFIVLMLFLSSYPSSAQDQSGSKIKLARVKYSGGGDWYNDQSSEVNLLAYIKAHTTIQTEPTYEFVDLSTDNIFLYPLLFLTGHGTMNLSEVEVKRLRSYLENGGFLYIDDDYGMDPSIRKEMKKVFPNQQFVELPFNHPLYSSHFTFPNGLPKIHEHDAKPPQGLGLFHEGKLCVFYTYETNPSDGWADPDVHHDPPEKREASLKIGTNIIVYALSR